MNPLILALLASQKRLEVFRDLATRAGEIKGMTLRGPELWEPEDQAALDQVELALRQSRGEHPLFENVS